MLLDADDLPPAVELRLVARDLRQLVAAILALASAHWRLPPRRRECQRQCRGALSRLSMRRAGSSGSLATLCPGQGCPCGRPGWSSRGGRAATGDKEFMK